MFTNVAGINNVNFKEKAELFAKDLASKGRSESTIIAYAKDIEQLLNYFSKKGVISLALEHFLDICWKTTILAIMCQRNWHILDLRLNLLEF